MTISFDPKEVAEIEQIRELLDDLELVKDQIIAFYHAQEKGKDSALQMWIEDLKECYYALISAWEMLRGFFQGNENYGQAVQTFLWMGQNRLTQVLSELNSFTQPKANELAAALKKSASLCHQVITDKLSPYCPQESFVPRTERVIHAHENEFHLPCAICGKISVVFKIGIARFEKERNLIFEGITHARTLGLHHQPALFDLLLKSDLSGVHAYCRKNGILEDGMDAYCPECDKIYCLSHYNAREEYDDGFYDCTYGTCPQGHSRLIDD